MAAMETQATRAAGRMAPLWGRDADARMVPEPSAARRRSVATPAQARASVTKVPACRPVAGVAAEAVDESPSPHSDLCGFPKPRVRSISDRRPIAS